MNNNELNSINDTNSQFTPQQPMNPTYGPTPQQPVNPTYEPTPQQPVNPTYDDMTQQPINPAFDDMAQQPINPAFDDIAQQPINPAVQPEPITPVSEIQTDTEDSINQSIQQQMMEIPTIDQDRQQFIDNTQSDAAVKVEKKEAKPNIAFIVILFVILFGAVIFLFPYLAKTIG